QRELLVEPLRGRAEERAIPRLRRGVADAVVVEHQHAAPGRHAREQGPQPGRVEQRGDALGAGGGHQPAGGAGGASAGAAGAGTASSRTPITGGLPVRPLCLGSGQARKPRLRRSATHSSTPYGSCTSTLIERTWRAHEVFSRSTCCSAPSMSIFT